MAKCEACGSDIDLPTDICPKCGLNPGPQTVTDLPRAKIKKKKRLPEHDRPKKERNVTCEKCRTIIPGNSNICPKCGNSPGPQAWTDLPGMRDK